MAEKNGAKASEKKADGKSARGRNGGLMRGVWGLVFLAAGVLLLISLLFYSPFMRGDGAEAVHILGPYLGTRLAFGMFNIFGRLAAFIFSGTVCYIGLAKLIGRPARIKVLFFLVLVALEVSLLSAISQLPALSAVGFAETAQLVGANRLGLYMASVMLVPLFGASVFGPYFILVLLTAITVMVGLHIRPQSIIAFAAQAFGEAKTGAGDAPNAAPSEEPEKSPDSPDPSATVDGVDGAGGDPKTDEPNPNPNKNFTEDWTSI